MTSGYVGSLVFIVVAGIAKSSVADIDNKTIAALLDPFGAQALESLTQYWTPVESNTRAIPFAKLHFIQPPALDRFIFCVITLYLLPV